MLVAGCRTAVGKAKRGSLATTRPEAMGAAVLDDLLKRAGDLDPHRVDDVIIGCAFPEAEQGFNLARLITLTLGWPDRISGMTVNRLCSSGVEAIAIGAHKILSRTADIVIAGGVESMSLVPMAGNIFSPHPALIETRTGAYGAVGLTAENVAERYGVGRAEQDAFAVRSHQRATAAVQSGRLQSQITPLAISVQQPLPNGHYEFTEQVFDQDEGIRPDTSIEGLAKLRPAFKIGGTVTAGNASQMSDGAAAVLLMTEDKARELGLNPLATFRHYATEGCEPEVMGVGPVVAVPKVLRQAGLTIEDIDLIEINEAFAAQAVYCMRELGLDEARTNVNGGAIAYGHPLGCTGALFTNMLVYEMHRQKARLGMVTMCVGFGMGAAIIYEVEEHLTPSELEHQPPNGE